MLALKIRIKCKVAKGIESASVYIEKEAAL